MVSAVDKKRWDIISQNFVETPEKVKSFLDDIKSVCEKHGMSISHEDEQGGFIIQNYDAHNINWLFDASMEVA